MEDTWEWAGTQASWLRVPAPSPVYSSLCSEAQHPPGETTWDHHSFTLTRARGKACTEYREIPFSGTSRWLSNLYALFLNGQAEYNRERTELTLELCNLFQIWEIVLFIYELPWWLRGKEPTCHEEDTGSIPGSGRAPGEGNANVPQYPCLGNPKDRGPWWATVPGVSIDSTK